MGTHTFSTLKMYSTMLKQALFADMAGPKPEDEIHHIAFDPVKGGAIRNEQFGMRANEKAGLTVGFAVLGFFFFVSVAFVFTIFARVKALEKAVEDLKLANEDANAKL